MPTALESTTIHNPKQNHLLAALPAAVFEAVAIHLELVPMLLGDMLYEPGERLSHAYFPTTAIIALYYVTISGATAATADVGSEGVLGVSLFMGGDTTPSSAVVQTAGHAYRLERRQLLAAFGRAGAFKDSLLRYTQALITQVSQAAVCYRHHSIDQQLSRWLLTTVERAPSMDLVMTQELVARLLGVRRESITEAAGRLRDAGHIRYRRGHIAVLDPRGLLRCACECYGVIKAERQRLLPREPEGQLAIAAG